MTPFDAAPVAHLRTVRRIVADPTSTALLLAAPTAFALWPGIRLIGQVAGRALVETDLPPDLPAAATVRAVPPRRTPTSYVCRFEWMGPDLPTTAGTLTLSNVGGATEATLVLDSTEPASSVLDAGVLADMAEGFLLNLARAAESRSRAA